MLQTIANIISIIAGIITILGIGGILSWSILKKDKSLLSDSVLSIFSYSLKTGFVILIGIPGAYLFFFFYSWLLVFSKGEADPLYWESGHFFEHFIAYFIVALFAMPIYSVICACIYKSSLDPWQRFWEIFFKKKKLEVIEARYYSVKNPNKYINATEEIKKMVRKGKRKFLVNNDIAGEPEKGARKELTVKYRLNGDERTETVKERLTMSLD